MSQPSEAKPHLDRTRIDYTEKDGGIKDVSKFHSQTIEVKSNTVTELSDGTENSDNNEVCEIGIKTDAGMFTQKPMVEDQGDGVDYRVTHLDTTAQKDIIDVPITNSITGRCLSNDRCSGDIQQPEVCTTDHIAEIVSSTEDHLSLQPQHNCDDQEHVISSADARATCDEEPCLNSTSELQPQAPCLQSSVNGVTADTAIPCKDKLDKWVNDMLQPESCINSCHLTYGTLTNGNCSDCIPKYAKHLQMKDEKAADSQTSDFYLTPVAVEDSPGLTSSPQEVEYETERRTLTKAQYFEMAHQLQGDVEMYCLKPDEKVEDGLINEVKVFQVDLHSVVDHNNSYAITEIKRGERLVNKSEVIETNISQVDQQMSFVGSGGEIEGKPDERHHREHTYEAVPSPVVITDTRSQHVAMQDVNDTSVVQSDDRSKDEAVTLLMEYEVSQSAQMDKETVEQQQKTATEIKQSSFLGVGYANSMIKDAGTIFNIQLGDKAEKELAVKKNVAVQESDVILSTLPVATSSDGDLVVNETMDATAKQEGDTLSTQHTDEVDTVAVEQTESNEKISSTALIKVSGDEENTVVVGIYRQITFFREQQCNINTSRNIHELDETVAMHSAQDEVTVFDDKLFDKQKIVTKEPTETMESETAGIALILDSGSGYPTGHHAVLKTDAYEDTCVMHLKTHVLQDTEVAYQTKTAENTSIPLVEKLKTDVINNNPSDGSTEPPLLPPLLEHSDDMQVISVNNNMHKINVHDGMLERSVQDNMHDGSVLDDMHKGNVRDDLYEGSVRDDLHEGSVHDDLHEGNVRDDLHEGNVRDDLHEGNVRDDLHEGSMPNGISVHNDMHESSVCNDMLERNVPNDSHNGSVHDDMHKINVHDGMLERSVRDKMHDGSVHDDMHKGSFHDDLHEGSVRDDLHEGSMPNDMLNRSVPNNTHESSVCNDMLERNVSKDSHNESVHDDMHDRSVCDDMFERYVHDNMHEGSVQGSVHDYKHEGSVHDDMIEVSVHEKMHEESILDDKLDRSVCDDMFERYVHDNMHEGSVQGSVHDYKHEGSVHDDMCEVSVHEKMYKESILDDKLDRSVHDGMHERSIHDEMLERKVPDDMQERSVHDGMHEESVQGDIYERSFQDDIHERNADDDIHERSSHDDDMYENERNCHQDRYTRIKSCIHSVACNSKLMVQFASPLASYIEYSNGESSCSSEDTQDAMETMLYLNNDSMYSEHDLTFSTVPKPWAFDNDQLRYDGHNVSDSCNISRRTDFASNVDSKREMAGYTSSSSDATETDMVSPFPVHDGILETERTLVHTKCEDETCEFHKCFSCETCHINTFSHRQNDAFEGVSDKRQEDTNAFGSLNLHHVSDVEVPADNTVDQKPDSANIADVQEQCQIIEQSHTIRDNMKYCIDELLEIVYRCVEKHEMSTFRAQERFVKETDTTNTTQICDSNDDDDSSKDKVQQTGNKDVPSENDAEEETPSTETVKVMLCDDAGHMKQIVEERASELPSAGRCLKSDIADDKHSREATFSHECDKRKDTDISHENNSPNKLRKLAVGHIEDVTCCHAEPPTKLQENDVGQYRSWTQKEMTVVAEDQEVPTAETAHTSSPQLEESMYAGRHHI